MSAARIDERSDQQREQADGSIVSHGSRGVLFIEDKRRRRMDTNGEEEEACGDDTVQGMEVEGSLRRPPRQPHRATLRGGQPIFGARVHGGEIQDIEQTIEFCERRCRSAPCSLRKLEMGRKHAREPRVGRSMNSETPILDEDPIEDQHVFNTVGEAQRVLNIADDLEDKDDKTPVAKRQVAMATPVVTRSMDMDEVVRDGVYRPAPALNETPDPKRRVDRNLLRESLEFKTDEEEDWRGGQEGGQGGDEEWQGEEEWVTWAALEDHLTNLMQQAEAMMESKIGLLADEMIAWRVDIENENISIKREQVRLARVVEDLEGRLHFREGEPKHCPRSEREHAPRAEETRTSSTTPARSVRKIEEKKTAFSTEGTLVEDIPEGRMLSGGYFTGGEAGSMGGADREVHVNHLMLGAPGQQFRQQGTLMGTSPALLALQASVRVPYFDGDENKWAEFEEDWERYAPYALLGIPEGQVGNVWKRDLLINCIHGVLRNKYKATILRTPSLTFTDVWEELVKLFRIDNPVHWRRRWGNVQLSRSGEDIKIQDWIFFESSFEVAKSRVQDWTEQEEVDLLMKQLPWGWRKKVLQREAKEAQSRNVVKMMGKLILEKVIRRIMDQLGVKIQGVEELRGCTLLGVPKTEDMNKLTSLRDLTIDGIRITFIQVRRRWRAADIFSFVQRELRVELETKTITNSMEGGGKAGKGGEGKGGAGWRSDWRTFPTPHQPARVQETAVAVEEVKYVPSCWTCKKAGKDDKHSWLKCKAAQDAWIAKGKEKGGKGKGKGRGGKGGKGATSSGGRGGGGVAE